MPASCIVFNSPASVIAFEFESCQTRRSDQILSCSFKIPSLLESYCFNASKPFLAFSPFGKRVLLPKSSAPLSIIPLLFKSKANNPSSAPTQPVLSKKPLLFKSKKFTFPFLEIVSTPSPSKSTTIGEKALCASEVLGCLPCKASSTAWLIFRGLFASVSIIR